MLSKKHLERHCLPYGGHLRCRYLAEDDYDYSKFYCLKKSYKKADIDLEVDAVLKLRDKGKDPEKQGIPIGNNCAGYLTLKNVLQGYDV